MKIDLTQFSQIFQQNIANGEQSFQQNLSKLGILRYAQMNILTF